MIRAFARMLRDSRGGAAIEFALIMPFLFVMHIAVGEMVQAWQVRTRVTHVASSLADVTSQVRSVTDADLTDIMNAGDAMMRPYPMEPLGERVSSLVADAQGVVRVDWTASRNFPVLPAPTLPAGFLAANQSIIVAEATYDYQPAFNLFLMDSFRLKHAAYIRPRTATSVERR